MLLWRLQRWNRDTSTTKNFLQINHFSLPKNRGSTQNMQPQAGRKCQQLNLRILQWDNDQN